MTVQDTIKSLREKHGLSQDQLAERVMVTRQAVSRWETGETQQMKSSAKSRMEVSMRTSVNGAMQTESLLIRQKTLYLIIWWGTCQIRTILLMMKGVLSLMDIFHS